MLSIKYLMLLISATSPAIKPINLTPRGGCGESAVTLIPSIFILPNAVLINK